jgi:hypothetical protein
MHHDSQAYWLRMGDSWTNIDYKKTAKEWMKPLEKGEITGMVEIPANWDVSMPFRCLCQELGLNGDIYGTTLIAAGRSSSHDVHQRLGKLSWVCRRTCD